MAVVRRKTLLRNISELVCISHSAELQKRGAAMNDIALMENAALLMDEHILWIGPESDASAQIDEHTDVVDCAQRCVMPGFVDSHTHMVFAGSRSHEFARRLQGASYQQIAAEGGGILSTVRAVRAASEDDLVANGRRVLLSALSYGTTTVEVKSGYALTLDDELKMLRAIRRLREELPIHIYATFLGAHDFPPEYAHDREAYVDLLCTQMIPAVAAEGLAEYCDAFCDVGYYTVEQTERIFGTAQEHGLKLRLHADELGCVHAAELAVRMNARSADHLLFVSEEGKKALGEGETVATLLPGTAYTLRLPYAPAQELMQAGACVALASDCNPGSSYSENMQQVLSLACMNMHMSMEQSLNAATLNGAAALDVSATRGSLEVGKEADLLLLDCSHYSELIYHYGVNHVQSVWIGGRRVHRKSTEG